MYSIDRSTYFGGTIVKIGIFGTTVLIIAILIVGCWGVALLVTSTYVGQRYDVTVIVQATEKSTRFGMHTNVWCLTYSGEDPLMYTFNGYHDFVIGETYRIVFINTYAILGWGIRGDVITVHQ
ncbi:unnamed protein product [marine sediment metagenome]|uniref:Uncharacterized protein n=1 Tax=marine sediment metagenome TaxID=412755 RepID=X1C0H4_9ZZZZ